MHPSVCATQRCTVYYYWIIKIPHPPRTKPNKQAMLRIPYSRKHLNEENFREIRGFVAIRKSLFREIWGCGVFISACC